MNSRRGSGGLVVAVLCLCGLGALLGWPGRCDAQAVQPREALQDAKLYFTAPLHWTQGDWLEFGATVAAVAATHQFDDNVRRHFVGSASNGLDGRDSKSGEDYLPALALLGGTWLLAGVQDVPAGWRELGSMLEASVLTATTGEILKLSIGRQRPYDTSDPNRWFKGGDSFPSQHAGISFAIGTVFAESGNDRDRWLRRILGYGVGGYTAYARLKHNAHWASDVVAGAALGFSTARFTLHRRQQAGEQVALSVVPTEGGGVMLALSMPLH